MKIEITLNGELYSAEYNAARGVHGYDSTGMENPIRDNERLINRAITAAEDADTDEGSAELRGNRCSVKLFYAN